MARVAYRVVCLLFCAAPSSFWRGADASGESGGSGSLQESGSENETVVSAQGLDVEGSISLPSSCTPDPLLPHGGLCVYGYQCASQFCCPRLKVCLSSPSSSVSSSQVLPGHELQSEIVSIIFGGGACTNPWANMQACMNTGNGQPLSSWDQSQCGCKDEYMTRYDSNTWVTLNADQELCGADFLAGARPRALPSASIMATAMAFASSLIFAAPVM